MRLTLLSSSLLLWSSLTSAAPAAAPRIEKRISSTYSSETTTVANALFKLYNSNTGQFNTDGWWQSGVGITTLADCAIAIPSLKTTYQNVWPTSLQNAQKTYSNFIDDYFDDEGWWALAWIRVYDLTGGQQYLKEAVSIFNNMLSTGANTTCGGGIYWNREHSQINAIANELFLSVAAHLANRVSNKNYYLDWAYNQWSWFQNSGLINSQNLINDGLDMSTCKNNGAQEWTYNHGVILGGLLEMSKATNNGAYISEATTIANAAITHFAGSNTGVLHEPGEPNLGTDGPQFKAIFMSNLIALYQQTPNSGWATFFKTNADSIWNNARNTSTNLVGNVWSGPVMAATAASQSSAVYAILGAAISN